MLFAGLHVSSAAVAVQIRKREESSSWEIKQTTEVGQTHKNSVVVKGDNRFYDAAIIYWVDALHWPCFASLRCHIGRNDFFQHINISTKKIVLLTFRRWIIPYETVRIRISWMEPTHNAIYRSVLKANRSIISYLVQGTFIAVFFF